DKKKLSTLLMQQLTQQGNADLKKELQPAEFLAPDSVLIDPDSSAFDHQVDDPADVLNLRLTATAYGLAVDRADLELLARALLQKQLPARYQLLPNGVQVDVQPGGKYQGVALRMPFRAIGYTTPQIDAGKVAIALQGKSIGEAKTYLSSQIDLAQPPEINITPMGWQRLPWFGFRIAVFVEPPAVVTQ
ncbi:MAG: hypothetical protein KGJ80_14130, partial [Chloroflexota bacterium]|nr:hypothetical protein [Chloroflexota bacterium]